MPRQDGPPPEDDLSLVLKRLMRRSSSTRKTREARQRLANHPLTREYLEAGLRLITAQFGPSADDLREDDDSWPRPSALFAWLSAQKVIDEVARGGRQRGNQGTFEDRWPYRDYYLEDLLAYALWVRHWSGNVAVAEKAAESLVRGPDFVAAVQEAAYQESRVTLQNQNARLLLIVIARSERYPHMRDSIARIFAETREKWIPVYEAMLAQRGLRLRADISLEEFAYILSSLSAGLAMRSSADPAVPFIDHERRRSLHGKATLAMLAGCIDGGDGKSLEELVRDLAALDLSARGRPRRP